MASSSLYFYIIALLILILTVESAYNVFTYDDGSGNQEHCCLVRTREKFCMAKPITRSLIQINKQCHRSDGSKHHRSHGKNRKDEYIDRIVQRLNIKSSHEFDDKILIELKNPLDKQILDNDLMCLKSTNNHKINFNKCYVELIDELDNDDDDDDDHNNHMSHNTRKHRKRPCHSHKYVDRKRHALNEDSKVGEDTVVKNNNKSVEKSQNEKRQIEIDQMIQILENNGFAMHQTFPIHPRRARPSTRKQRKCWHWYRKQTRKLRRNPLKYNKTCIDQTDHHESCINQLIYNKLHMNKTHHYENRKLSFSKGSKLYCENQAGHSKLLGQHHQSQLCFHADDRITIENTFTDIIGLSDIHKNKRVLEFIAKDEKLTAEFVNDCHDETTLNEINEVEQKRMKHSS